MDESAGWNRGLEPIAPLADQYAREMGETGEPAGRLMAALSLPTDPEDSSVWDGQSPRARDTVRSSRLLVASGPRIVAAAEAEQGDTIGRDGAIDDALNHLAEGHIGSHRS